MKRKFRVELSCMATIELDQKVIDAVDDEWIASLYNLRTPEQIAEHIAYNLIVNQASLTELAGWADQNNEYAKIITEHWKNVDATELEAE